jgi:hypothetical protein
MPKTETDVDVVTTQVAFQVLKSATQSNIATGSAVTVTWDVESFDTNGDFASNTFTAPSTGKYLLATTITLGEVDSAATTYTVNIVTSNGGYNFRVDPRQYTGDTANHSMSTTIIADMDANDTAYITVQQSGGTQQTDINGGSDVTYFSGNLLS